MQTYSTFQKKVTLAHELPMSPDYKLSLSDNNKLIIINTIKIKKTISAFKRKLTVLVNLDFYKQMLIYAVLSDLSDIEKIQSNI